LPTDTVQTIHFRVTLNSSEIGENALSPPIVNTAWLTDTAHGKSVSAMIIVNARVFYLPLILNRAALPLDQADVTLSLPARDRLREPDERSER
jgi:hypothetical protein